MKSALLMATVALSSSASIAQAAGIATAGQTTAAATNSSSRFDPAPVVAEIRRIIGEEYVLPERRPALDAVLAEGLSSGRYKLSDPALFAQRLNEDLARVGRDHHLNFNYNPQMVAAMTAGRRGPGPAAERGPPPGQVDAARRENHGLRELRVLPGNVRYLDLNGFEWIGEESEAVINSAMAFLKGGDAVIIDLRRNGGGAGRAVHQFISYFVKPDTPLITFYKGGAASPTMRSLPGLSSMVGKPLYVLTSGGSGSAAEEFVGHVAGYKLGEVVGEATSGAAYMNAIFPVDGRFELSVSVARPVLAATGKDWEATGIAPTIAVPPEAALQTAHVHAIRKLAAAADPSRRAALEGLAEGIEASSRPGTPAAPLTAYVGTYGDRHVSLDGGKLWLQQQRRLRRLMVPLGGNRFTLAEDPSMRVEFNVAGGRSTSFSQGPAGGPVLARFERTR